jgi:hypothetical protein
LLSLTCTDIGTNPLQIESKLTYWFKIAKHWGAVLLIDEADIYMELRITSHLERNNLVAGFLRAMEYYQGILFLTTNRVGTFDDAFISRIHVSVHYPEFDEESRVEVWESFIKKLERENGEKMVVTDELKKYITKSKELRAVKWNGREIRNGQHAQDSCLFQCSKLIVDSISNCCVAGGSLVSTGLGDGLPDRSYGQASPVHRPNVQRIQEIPRYPPRR